MTGVQVLGMNTTPPFPSLPNFYYYFIPKKNQTFVCKWHSGPAFQDFNARFQALNARFQDLDLRTWVSSPRYLALRTWVSGPRKLSILRSSYLFPVTFLYVHRHFSFSRHFSLRPPSLIFFPSLFSASSGHTQTHGSASELKCRGRI
jgi:hypothetical protein